MPRRSRLSLPGTVVCALGQPVGWPALRQGPARRGLALALERRRARCREWAEEGGRHAATCKAEELLTRGTTLKESVFCWRRVVLKLGASEGALLDQLEG
mmetsp:Transcript_44114/g.89029  ORF Transcript_44114/g.89029 Transcript_44114/m.89029 type:complete len:100 (-) Transcript_44114:283-582(-)